LTGTILNEFKQRISSFKLVPYRGGAFEVVLDGQLVYSKLETGEFPDEAAILNLVGARLKKK
jgi:selenoprotein W-related protein